MKNVLVIIAFLFIEIVYSNSIINNTIVLEKQYKTESTFSEELSKQDSFHLIFTKNRKTKVYEVFSYLFNGEKIIELPSLTNEKPYEIVSFHQKDGILSLLLSYKNKKKFFLRRVNYNTSTKQKTESEVISHDNFATSIRTKDKSILIYKTDDILKVSSFLGNTIIENKELLLEKNTDLKSFFNNQSITSIKTDEFVANGATNKLRLYFDNNILFFTKDLDVPINKYKPNNTQLLKLDLSDVNPSPKIYNFEYTNDKKLKKSTSFYAEDKRLETI